MYFLKDLDAFYLEHRRCRKLEAEVWEETPDQARVWMACSRGAE
jgi:hypothetical protein